jgi:hypothetical protein
MTKSPSTVDFVMRVARILSLAPRAAVESLS